MRCAYVVWCCFCLSLNWLIQRNTDDDHNFISPSGSNLSVTELLNSSRRACWRSEAHRSFIILQVVASFDVNSSVEIKEHKSVFFFFYLMRAIVFLFDCQWIECMHSLSLNLPPSKMGKREEGHGGWYITGLMQREEVSWYLVVASSIAQKER